MVYQKAGWCANTFNRKWDGISTEWPRFYPHAPRMSWRRRSFLSLLFLRRFRNLFVRARGRPGWVRQRYWPIHFFAATRARRLRRILLLFRDLFLLHQKLRSIQQRTAERGVVTSPGSL